MASITFQPSGTVVEVAAGQNIRDAGLSAGVDIPSTCGGVGSCGLCTVKITEGTDQLSPVTEVELGKLGNVFFITKERLSCQAQVLGDVTCEVPDNAPLKNRKAAKNRDLSRHFAQNRARSKAR